MKSDELHQWLTRLAVEAGADIDRAHERMAQAVCALVALDAVEFRAPQPSTLPAPPMPCDAEHQCGACADCDIADEDDDAPSRADLHRADSEALNRELSRMAWQR